MKDIFDRHYRRYDAWYDRNRLAYLSEIEALKEAIPEEGRGLEIGVGTGRFAEPLEIGMGIDPAANMLKIAKQRSIDVREGIGEDLPFENVTFDYVTIIITMCFVQDPQKVLKEARRVLKKNGKIIIGIIDKDSFLGKFYQKKKSVFYKGASFFSVKEVADLLKAAGFSKFSYYQTISELPHKMSSLEKPRKGFGKGGFVVISSTKI